MAVQADPGTQAALGPGRRPRGNPGAGTAAWKPRTAPAGRPGCASACPARPHL